MICNAARPIHENPGTAAGRRMDDPRNDQEIRRRLGGLHAESFGWALSCCTGDPQEAEEVL